MLKVGAPNFISERSINDRALGLVVRILCYIARYSGFDSRCYQIF
jgi:hypothetical protein